VNGAMHVATASLQFGLLGGLPSFAFHQVSVKAGLVSHHQLFIGNFDLDLDVVQAAVMLAAWSLDHDTTTYDPFEEPLKNGNFFEHGRFKVWNRLHISQSDLWRQCHKFSQ